MISIKFTFIFFSRLIYVFIIIYSIVKIKDFILETYDFCYCFYLFIKLMHKNK